MVIETVPAGRAALRDHFLSAVTRALEGRAQTIESGPLEGISVVSLGHVNEAIAEVALAQLPAVDESTAEVLAPATITVVTPCPRCGVTQDMDVQIDRTLLIDPGVAHLKLKAKSAQRVHVCGQLTWPSKTAPVEGQEGFGLEDITEEPDNINDLAVPPSLAQEAGEADPLPETCPFPDCRRPADHRGKHSEPTIVSNDESDSDLLP